MEDKKKEIGDTAIVIEEHFDCHQYFWICKKDVFLYIIGEIHGDTNKMKESLFKQHIKSLITFINDNLLDFENGMDIKLMSCSTMDIKINYYNLLFISEILIKYKHYVNGK